MHKTFSITSSSAILNNPIEYIQGVSTLRGDMLRKELEIFTFNDLLNYFPLRHVDKTKVDKIAALNFNTDYAQVAGKITDIDIVGEKRMINKSNAIKKSVLSVIISVSVVKKSA